MVTTTCQLLSLVTDTMYMISRAESIAKLFFVISFVGLFLYIVLAFYTFHTAYLSVTKTRRYQNKIQSYPDPNMAPLKASSDIKHILLWTKGNNSINPVGEGQEPFINYDCLHQNCYITTNKQHLNDYTKFNAVVFNASDLRRWNQADLPISRSWDQKYVFHGMIPAKPICHPNADTYFNWTWSYKLHSDIVNPFILVKNLKGHVLAPNSNVYWNTKMYQPINVMENPYPTKKKAVVWILRECVYGFSVKTLQIVNGFRRILATQRLGLDIFGCNHKPCENNECYEIIKRDYFFYLVYDGTLSHDYMTDEVVTAFETETVPLIIGNFDMDKFLPPGSYIYQQLDDVLNVESMVELMFYAIKNPPIYNRYFRWKKHYTIERAAKFHGLCQLCSNLNNDVMMQTHTHYEMFRHWWFPGAYKNLCLINTKTLNIGKHLPLKKKSMVIQNSKLNTKYK